MAILLENQTDYALTDAQLKWVEKAVTASIQGEQCPYEVEVSITFVSNDEIKALNQEFRDKDCVTDVLSFPLIDFELPGHFEEFSDDELNERFNLDTNELMLGDIVVSLDKAVEQALAYGHSFERELAFLIVHSMLHLFGYDHMEADEEIVMFKIQENILNEIGLSR